VDRCLQVLYNPDPDAHGFASDARCADGTLRPCEYLALPREGVVAWDEREVCESGIPLDDFAHLMMAQRESFSTPEEWNAAAYHTSSSDTVDGSNVSEGWAEGCARRLAADDEDGDGGGFGGDGGGSGDGSTPPASSISHLGKRFREHILRTSSRASGAGIGPRHPRPAPNLALKPFDGQVAGHPMTFMELGDNLLAKPVRATTAQELVFYQRLFDARYYEGHEQVSSLLPFLPRYHGEIFVDAGVEETAEQTVDGVAGGRTFARRYSLTIPQRYSLVELSTAELRTQHSAAAAAAARGGLETRTRADVPSGEAGEDCSSSSLGVNTNDERCRHEGQVCMVLENLVAPFAKPCVLDLKIGTRQHGDDAEPSKRDRSIKRCESTTSSALGLRVSGMRVWHPDDDDNAPRTWSKDYGKSLRSDNFIEVLESFFDAGRAHGAIRKGVVEQMRQRVSELHDVIKDVEAFRFFSSSLLLIYEGSPDADHGHADRVDVRLIDFARVRFPDVEHEVPIDHSAATPQELWPALEPHEKQGADDGALLGLATLRDMLGSLLEQHTS
jgi:inositol-hexakisphosphate kinase